MESPRALKAQGIQQQFFLLYSISSNYSEYIIVCYFGQAIIPISVDLLTRIFHLLH